MFAGAHRMQSFMSAPRLILAAASSVATVLVLAASADGATLATSPCVRTVGGQGMARISGTGFTPLSSVSVRSVPAGVFTSAVADAAGSFTTTSSTPGFNPFSRQLQTVTIAAADGIDPALTAATTYKQVRVGYTTNPASGPPTLVVTHTVRGFTPAKNVWLHFRFGGRTKRNAKVGRANSPCGIASRRMRLLPTRSRAGLWIVYVDQSRSFSLNTRPQLKYGLRIRRTG
jgi:hypothetical protein